MERTGRGKSRVGCGSFIPTWAFVSDDWSGLAMHSDKAREKKRTRIKIQMKKMRMNSLKRYLRRWARGPFAPPPFDSHFLNNLSRIVLRGR